MDQAASEKTDRDWGIKRRIKAGPRWANLKNVKPGDRLFTDGGFTCMEAGELKVVRRDEGGQLYVACRDGKHLLDGQNDGDGKLIGVYYSPGH